MLLHYIIALVVAGLAVLLGIIIGDYGPWYMCWFLGTGFMILVSASAGVLFEAQEEASEAEASVGLGDVVGVVAGKAPAGPGGGHHG
ncbi:hypothetical protein [Xanthobacter agilis]|uniref:Uncharacterized protein n=1 Tax=Xanthobacter agilis TaxID=47492 RepID=A0ABU0L7V9_XANAG|nr:hypothetical protein [Xanthobacter agilis]MDQ0503242.1 hypothetical protein [Xanthobacter agilis]